MMQISRHEGKRVPSLKARQDFYSRRAAQLAQDWGLSKL